MADALAEIDAVANEGEAELAGVQTPDALEQWRIKYLGTKGRVKGLMNLIGQVPPEQKKRIGQRANAGEGPAQHVVRGPPADDRRRRRATSGTAVDVTEPGRKPELGNRHILMKVIDELTELFGRMGFAVASGPEVEDEFHNFVALNIPASHPARDPLDNFYLEGGGGGERAASCCGRRRARFRSA